eukprot:4619-Hanusia_phi.AAC.2
MTRSKYFTRPPGVDTKREAPSLIPGVSKPRFDSMNSETSPGFIVEARGGREEDDKEAEGILEKGMRE